MLVSMDTFFMVWQLPAEAPFIKERGALFDQLYEVQLAEVAGRFITNPPCL